MHGIHEMHEMHRIRVFRNGVWIKMFSARLRTQMWKSEALMEELGCEHVQGAGSDRQKADAVTPWSLVCTPILAETKAEAF